MEHTDTFNKQRVKVSQGARGQRSGASRLFSHSCKANLVPVLTRSRSGPLTGARLTNTEVDRVESLSTPSLETGDTLWTQQEVKGQGNTRPLP